MGEGNFVRRLMLVTLAAWAVLTGACAARPSDATDVSFVEWKSSEQRAVTFEYNAPLDPLEPLLGQMRGLVERLRPRA